MKKNLVIASLLISTIVSIAAPAMAVGLNEALCNVQKILGDRRCSDNRPSHRDDRRDDNRPGRRDDRRDDYRPSPNQVWDISDRGQWVRLSLNSTFVTSVEVRGLGGDVRVLEAIAYPDYRREVPVYSSGRVIDVRVPNVSYIDVYVKARGGNRGPTHAEFTVYSPRGPVFVKAERIGRR